MLPRRRAHGLPQERPLLLQPLLKIGCSGDEKSGRQVTRPESHRIAHPSSRQVGTNIQHVALQGVKVEANPGLTSSNDCIVTQGMTEGVQGVTEGMAGGCVVGLGPEQRQQPVARMQTGRLGQCQVEQQGNSLRLGQAVAGLVQMACPDLQGAQQPQLSHAITRGDRRVTY